MLGGFDCIECLIVFHVAGEDVMDRVPGMIYDCDHEAAKGDKNRNPDVLEETNNHDHDDEDFMFDEEMDFDTGELLRKVSVLFYAICLSHIL